MGSLAGNFQRPVVAAAAVALASFSTNISDKIPSPNPVESCSTSEQSHLVQGQGPSFSWSSQIADSKLMNMAFVNRIRVPVPNINFQVKNWSDGFIPNTLGSSPSLFPLVNLYQSAELAKGPHSSAYTKTIPTSCPDVLYRWHLPDVDAIDLSGTSDCSLAKSKTVVVLLGWLGSKQKHLKKYAEWYTARGFHVITFTFPMSEVLSYQVGGKAEQDVELLMNHLADWLDGEHGKNLVFHTFSNTGWLTYGVMLEKFQKHDPLLLGRIKGCIVDSAPVAAPDPQVWALGFSAAFLKKNSIATKVQTRASEPAVEVSVGSKTTELKPAVSETALLMILEKFFGVVLNIPTVNKRLTDVLDLLSSKQPSCPQLYIYSSADRVIPASSVESFIEEQRKAGQEVMACDFVYTPHVDHFRNDPKRYTTRLSQFLDDCVITRCKS